VALNKAVPLLYNALASGEMLPVTELNWYSDHFLHPAHGKRRH
jgi:type VI protein secretion system component Hcp